jgi:UDP-glucose 4-epimerase
MQRRILITGGAGYIGSHFVAHLVERGDQVVVVDDLSLGHRQSVLSPARLIEADIGDASVVDAVLSDGPWHAVCHFAGVSSVGESMTQPFRYLERNGVVGVRLVEASVRHKVPRFVLSSTANLFGNPKILPVPADAEIEPTSPYGDSKYMIERALVWADRIHGLRSATLRYFNAAGADPAGRLGEDHTPETHLIPLAIDTILGRRPELSVYGCDYPTPDGTCIRDYIHVTDLAAAHIDAMERLSQGSVTYNVGTGSGHSVLAVIRAVEEVSGLKMPMRVVERRAGDPAMLVAAAEKIFRETGWRPKFPELHDMVRTAYAWREAHPDGYGPN